MPDYFNDPLTKRARYESLRSGLLQQRTTFDSHWQELGKFISPSRVRLNGGSMNQGNKQRQDIIDSTAGFASRTLASGMHAGLTSPARPWMKLTTPDPGLAKQGPVKEWLHEITQRMLIIFQQTNLYQALPTIYGDLGTFGTSAVAIREDSRDLFRCKSFAIGTYAIGLDERDMVCTFVRDYEMSVRQVIKEFALRPDRSIDWSVVSPTIKSLWDRGNYEALVKVTWIVTPNENANPDMLAAKYFPFSSCHFETGGGAGGERRFLKESGYRTFPLLVPRWDVTDGDSYGTECPGMIALGDVKQLQIEQRRKGQAIAKMVDPPLVGPPALRASKTSLLPGDITYADEREGMKGLRSIHDVNLRIDHLAADINDVQYRIDRAYYADLFLMMARSDQGQPITAREVEERHEEKLLALGPVLERTNDELLDPLVDRVYSMMELAGLIPPVPEALNGVKLRVEYISIMAQAQKMVGVVQQDRFMQTMLGLQPVFNGVSMKVKINDVVDTYADMLGIDPSLVRTNEEADALAAEAAKAMQAQQEADVMKTQAQAIQAAGTTPMDGGETALTRVADASQAVM